MPYLLMGIFFRKFFLLQTFKWMKAGFQKVKLFFPEIFSKGCVDNRAPPLILLIFLNTEMGYVEGGT